MFKDLSGGQIINLSLTLSPQNGATALSTKSTLFIYFQGLAGLIMHSMISQCHSAGVGVIAGMHLVFLEHSMIQVRCRHPFQSYVGSGFWDWYRW